MFVISHIAIELACTKSIKALCEDCVWLCDSAVWHSLINICWMFPIQGSYNVLVESNKLFSYQSRQYLLSRQSKVNVNNMTEWLTDIFADLPFILVTFYLKLSSESYLYRSWTVLGGWHSPGWCCGSWHIVTVILELDPALPSDTVDRLRVSHLPVVTSTVATGCGLWSVHYSVLTGSESHHPHYLAAPGNSRHTAVLTTRPDFSAAACLPSGHWHGHCPVILTS